MPAPPNPGNYVANEPNIATIISYVSLIFPYDIFIECLILLSIPLPLISMKYLTEAARVFNTLRASVRYIRTLISPKKQQFTVALPTP